MQYIIENFINKMQKEDIIKFAKKNGLNPSTQEIDFIYNFIKDNYKIYLNNPDSLNITLYQDRFSHENYIFLNNLINKYKRMIK